MSKAVRILAAALGLLVLAGVSLMAFAWRSAIGPVVTPTADHFSAASIREARSWPPWATVRHVIRRPAAGFWRAAGPCRRPFGTIFSTNITPDAATGIGRWSQAAFQRAMREGVDREGRHLYPRFPTTISPWSVMRTTRLFMLT